MKKLMSYFLSFFMMITLIPNVEIHAEEIDTSDEVVQETYNEHEHSIGQTIGDIYIYYECSECGKYFEDAAATKEIRDIEVYKHTIKNVSMTLPKAYINQDVPLGTYSTSSPYCKFEIVGWSALEGYSIQTFGEEEQYEVRIKIVPNAGYYYDSSTLTVNGVTPTFLYNDVYKLLVQRESHVHTPVYVTLNTPNPYYECSSCHKIGLDAALSEEINNANYFTAISTFEFELDNPVYLQAPINTITSLRPDLYTASGVWKDASGNNVTAFTNRDAEYYFCFNIQINSGFKEGYIVERYVNGIPVRPASEIGVSDYLYYMYMRPIDNHTHSLTKVTNDGLNPYYTCICGKYFKDQYGNNEIKNIDTYKKTIYNAQITIGEPKEGESFDRNAVAQNTSLYSAYLSDWYIADYHGLIGWSEVAQASTEYEVMICVEANEGYILDEKSVYINGKLAKAYADSNFGVVLSTGAHKHAGTLVPQVDATCSEAGKKAYYTCLCGKYYEDSACTKEINNINTYGILPKTDVHTNGGSYSPSGDTHNYYCTVCHKLISQSHIQGTLTGYVAPTFDKDGQTGEASCSLCGHKMIQNKVLPALKYIKESAATMEPATIDGEHCVNDLVVTSNDPSKYTARIARVFDITDPSLNTGSQIDYPKDVPFVVGHQYTIEIQFTKVSPYVYNESEPVYGSTFTLNGAPITQSKTSNLIYSTLRAVTLTAIDTGHTHSLTKVNAKGATCTENGNTAYYTCSCGNWFVDSAATKRILDKSSVITSKLGHKEISADNGFDSTCTSIGKTSDTKCERCGITLVTGTEIPKKDHEMIDIPAIQVTCTTDGSTKGEKCKNCTYVSIKPLTIPKLGHDMKEETVAPEIGKTGYDLHYCSRCDYSYKDNYKEALKVGWSTLDGNKVYVNTDGSLKKGWQTIDGKKYYFNEEGALLTGLRTISGNLYYFNEDMKTGWQSVGSSTYYFNTEGKAIDGLQKINNNWYYFSSYILRKTNTTINGDLYQIDVDGKIKTGWVEDSTGWRYVEDTNCKYVKNTWKTIGSKNYYFTSAGYMATGIQNVDSKKYFFDEKGSLKTGWCESSGKKYYAEQTGELVINSWKKIDNKWYYFDSNGVMMTGPKLINGTCYFFDKNGVMKTGWFTMDDHKGYADSNGAVVINAWKKLDTSWYFFDINGYMATGFKTIDGIKYYFDENGIYKTGWISDGGYWYYFDTSTKSFLKSTWLTLNNKKYYFDSLGHMVTGKQTIGGKDYFFNASGALSTGLVSAGDHTYYVDPTTGVAVSNKWVKVDGLWYYFNSSSEMATGLVTIDGKLYYLKNEMKTGWQQVDGLWYYFNTSGAALNGLQQINSKWYYFFNYKMQHIAQIDGEFYNFESNGAMKTGWIDINSAGVITWKYVDSATGKYVKDAWKKINEKWYYFKGTVMVTGIQMIDGNVYNMTTGAMRTVAEWYKNADGTWYYFLASGKAASGWLKIGTKWYYFHPDTKLMAHDETLIIEGVEYIFASNGSYTKA